MNEEKKLNLPQSLILLLLIIISVAVCIRLKTGGPMIGLFASWIFIYLFCKAVRIPYDHVVSGAYESIRMVVPTLCLLMAIGVMIGTWLQSGTIATIIVWGLQMINPAWLLPLTLIFCSVLSLVTGTSYGSVGSAGVAMMAIGNAMGINPGMVAGAVICGAMFGDKLSPLSDTTNLAPAVAGAKIRRPCPFYVMDYSPYLCDHFRIIHDPGYPADQRQLYRSQYVCLHRCFKRGVPVRSGHYDPGSFNHYPVIMQGKCHLCLRLIQLCCRRHFLLCTA